jgi:integrase
MGATWTKRGKSFRVAIHANGERRYVTVRSKSDAEGLVREIRRQELAGVNVLEAVKAARESKPAPSSFPTVRAAVLDYINAQVRAGELRESTALNYRNRVWKWLFPACGNIPVDKLTREQVGAVVRTIREAGRSNGVRRGVINPLRGMYTSLIETKQLPQGFVNPCADLKWFLGKKREQATNGMVPFFTKEEMPKVLDAFRALHPRWCPFVLTAFLSGLRYGEIAALERDDLDGSTLTVQRAVSRGKASQTKNSKIRHVKVSPVLVRALREHMEAMDLDAQAGNWSAESRRLMFPTTHGNRLQYVYFQEHVWTPTLRAAKVVYRKFHSTRHSYAAHLLSAGADPRFVADQLGHSKVSMTLDVYGRWISKAAHEHHVAALDRLVQ